jgi:predicted acyltransferase
MKERYYSLDIFRGATVAFMILVNNQAGQSYGPLDHAPWHGLTPTDLVFPFFLFAVGNALSFVMPRLKQQDRSAALGRIFRRSALIFLIGFLLNWFPFIRWEHDSLVFRGWTYTNDSGVVVGVRVMGVLARIALCYLFGSLLVYFLGLRGSLVASAVLLLGYWLLCYTLGTPGDPYSLNGYFGTAVDKALFGPEHLYHGEGVAFDPEGIPSTMAAITQVVFGYMVGWYIQQKGKNYTMLRNLVLMALAFLAVGYVWSLAFPVNKKIWTSSFVLVSTGYATLMLALLVFVIEFKHLKGWGSRFFDVFGKNPLFIFVLSGVVPRLLGLIRIPNPAGGKPVWLSPLSWFFHQVCQPLSAGNAKNASLIYALTLILLYWLVGYILDKRKIYIRV